MNPVVGYILLFLIILLIVIYLMPVYLQSREMFKNTQKKWGQEEEDIEKLSQMVANLKEETDLLDHRENE